MSDVTATPPPKAGRGKHRPSKSSAARAPNGQAVPFNPQQNPHHLNYYQENAHHQPGRAASEQLFPFHMGSDGQRLLELSDGSAAQYRGAPHDQMGTDNEGIASDTTPSSGKKRRAGAKSRPQDTRHLSSPARAINSSQLRATAGALTQPHNVTPPKRATNSTHTAYAGPTFHASPAPSALPIPSFLSKSVPDPPAHKGFQTMLDEQSDSSQPSPSRAPISSLAQPAGRDDSPLEMLFKAARDEKARSSSNAGGMPGLPTPHRGSPAPHASPSPSPSPARFRGRSGLPVNEPSGGEIFSLDMEAMGTPERLRSSDTAMEKSGHVEGVRPGTASSHSKLEDLKEEAERRAKTRALKDLLLRPQSQTALSATSPFPASAYKSADLAASQSPSPASHGNGTSANAENPARTAKHPVSGPSLGSVTNVPGVRPGAGTGSPRPVTRSSQLREEAAAVPSEMQDGVKASTARPFNHTRLSSTEISRRNLDAHLLEHGESLSRPGGREPLQTPRDVQNIEDSLRRMLNLGVRPPPGAASHQSHHSSSR